MAAQLSGKANIHDAFRLARQRLLAAGVVAKIDVGFKRLPGRHFQESCVVTV